MMDIKNKLRKIDNTISDKELFLKYGLLSLTFFEIREYMDLINEINKERDTKRETSDRKNFIPLYKKVFLSQRKKLNSILENIKNRTIDIYPLPTETEMKNRHLKTLQYDDTLSVYDNLFKYAEQMIKRAILATNQELYVLRNYPSVYYNHKNAYIGGDFKYRYKNEMIIYKNVYATEDEMHHFTTYTNDNNSLSDQRALLNILA